MTTRTTVIVCLGMWIAACLLIAAPFLSLFTVLITGYLASVVED